MQAPLTVVQLLKASYWSLGVIYGDMGTSPLYVFSSTFLTPPTDKRDVVGSLSLIFWTITMIAVVKYVLIVLNADDNGEGTLHPNLFVYLPIARFRAYSHTCLATIRLWQSLVSSFIYSSCIKREEKIAKEEQY